VSSENWYRQSSHREDTHFGSLDDDDVVHARCGTFTPQVGLFGDFITAVEVPMQHGQACQVCCGLLEISVEEVESPPPNYARALPPAAPASVPVLWPALPPAARPAPPVRRPTPPSPTAPSPPAPSDGATPKTCWIREKRGDIHWVTTTARGSKNTACGVALRRGKWEQNPPPDRICRTCDERRPR
jgi:hypothetical protein